MRPCIFLPLMENTRPLRNEMDRKVFISRQTCHFLFVNEMINNFSPNLYLIWLINNFISCQGKVFNRRSESTKNNKIMCIGWNSRPIIDKTTQFCFSKLQLKIEWETQSLFDYFPSKMAALRTKSKLAANAREGQKEHPRNSQSRNTADPKIKEEVIT